jgi:hypothetical protein
MARCRVSYKNSEGIHSVEVTAETLYEAVAQAIVEFKEDKTIATPPGPETEITVVALRKPAEHTIRLKRVHEWAQFSNTVSPAERLRRERVRKMLSTI